MSLICIDFIHQQSSAYIYHTFIYFFHIGSSLSRSRSHHTCSSVGRKTVYTKMGNNLCGEWKSEVAEIDVDDVESDGGKLNINTASVDELVESDHLGGAMAARLVCHRAQSGPFLCIKCQACEKRWPRNWAMRCPLMGPVRRGPAICWVVAKTSAQKAANVCYSGEVSEVAVFGLAERPSSFPMRRTVQVSPASPISLKAPTTLLKWLSTASATKSWRPRLRKGVACMCRSSWTTYRQRAKIRVWRWWSKLTSSSARTRLKRWNWSTSSWWWMAGLWWEAL